jgi:hypothetical protein
MRRTRMAGTATGSCLSFGMLAALTILVTWSARSLEAQQVRGVVTDTAGRPLAEAVVILPDVQKRTRTDSLGRFELESPMPGRQTLRVLLIGYRMNESRVTVPADAPVEVRIAMQVTRQVLDTVRVVDVESCAPHTVRGFECRRDGGPAWYRDAGEIRSMQPDTWADMLDGMPGLRRIPVMTKEGLEYRVGPSPSMCLRESYNGYEKRWDGHIRRVPEVELIHRDVVAIEYYDDFKKVPKIYERLAWPKDAATPCALIIYWLRGATRNQQNIRKRNDVMPADPRRPPARAPFRMRAVL